MMQVATSIEFQDLHEPCAATPSNPGFLGRGEPTLSQSEVNAPLIAVAERSCRPSFQRLYVLKISRLFAIVCRINRDPGEAEEILQETHVKIWSQCGQFDQTKGLRYFGWRRLRITMQSPACVADAYGR